ncbi:cysteine desulfurase DndA [Mycobacterium intermedium]|uniref:cysteine desulfurase n=1 Tax=Mycobacterium intermedium TaxID=28445 RepID=A0A1E3SAF7_MYCIE|nr:cysteine desulfurase DndA [Mycobacterium intermedium]MCV6967761.1 cysteine desulfurase DndA [Mycobacterium intermedium]ODQ99145.1 cysteine desulfurase DndA [Mycobacterium intermedium]OPE50550.1 cysteine desulfurase DndA [Mycobacterium intermedium]ORB05495.1 cysteine desulfurase DndA [Mycobacterium intermedium]
MTVTATTDTPGGSDAQKLQRPVYLDCNATTPVEPAVMEEIVRWTVEEFGNAGSRTHHYGQAAKNRVNAARADIASVVDACADEVVFTSGATESNNLAILGLASHGVRTGRLHIVSTQIEHKSVLGPLDELSRRGFDVTLIRPTPGGWVDPDEVQAALRADTLLVSTMAVNNETGVVQPIAEIADALKEHEAFFHVDAAQAFGKIIAPLRLKRIDLMSISGHKIYGPKGIGALMTRRRRFSRLPLEPLQYGGGQERGLRPGTLPVALIAGFGLAASLALQNHEQRAAKCAAIKREALASLLPLGIGINGDPDRTIEHTINFSVPGVDSEAAIVALKNLAAVSNGSACTSQSYEPSHVLVAAGLPSEQIEGALRMSWSHLTVVDDWTAIAETLGRLARP